MRGKVIMLSTDGEIVKIKDAEAPEQLSDGTKSTLTKMGWLVGTVIEGCLIILAIAATIKIVQWLF